MLNIKNHVLLNLTNCNHITQSPTLPNNVTVRRVIQVGQYDTPFLHSYKRNLNHLVRFLPIQLQLQAFAQKECIYLSAKKLSFYCIEWQYNSLYIHTFYTRDMLFKFT